MCDCGLNIGDKVDWVLIKSNGEPATRQRRFWHGQIVDLWNTTLTGHWFVVRWDSSNLAGPYSGPALGIDPDFVPYSPHFFQTICSELRPCNTGALHPTSNSLSPRQVN